MTLQLFGRHRSVVALLVLLVATGLVWFFWNDRSARPEIRNVVLVSIDTCRADHLSCYGYAHRTTPHIDAIARDGVVFTNAHSTNPITLPAHSSMLTGTIPPYHRVHDNHNYRLAESNVTLAEILRNRGFQTAAFVGAFVLNSRFGLDQGFGTYDDEFGAPIHGQLRTGIQQRRAEKVSAAAVRWLDEHRDDRFFIFLHYFDPHGPYDPPQPFASKYADNLYAGEIAYTDYCVGQVIAELKHLGVYDSTLIIITSDHGESLGEHGESAHSYFIYESTIRIPLIIKAPGVAQGKESYAPVSVTDLVPTVLSLLGLTVPPHVQGQDLAGHLFGRGPVKNDRYIYCESLYPTKFGCNPLRGLIHGQWKYIRTLKSELYDLGRDVFERNNLVEEEQETAEGLENRLREILDEQGRADVAGRQQTMDAASLARLRSLGYIDGGRVHESFEVDPDLDDPKDFVDIYRRVMNAYSLCEQRRFDEAQTECLEIQARRPEILQAYYLLGLIAAAQGRTVNSVAHFSHYLAKTSEARASAPPGKALPREFEIGEVHFLLGGLLSLLGDKEKAIEHYRQALKIIPYHRQSYVKLCNALRAQGKLDEAMAHSRRVLTVDPHFLAARLNLGELLEAQGKLGAAIEQFREALKIQSDSSNVHFSLGIALMKQGEMEQAREHLRQSRRSNASTLSNRAWAMATDHDAKMRSPTQAVLLAEVAAELTQYQTCKVLDTLAAAYAASGQFDKATTTAEKALHLAAEANDTILIDSVRKRLQLYRQSKFFVQPTPQAPAR